MRHVPEHRPQFSLQEGGVKAHTIVGDQEAIAQKFPREQVQVLSTDKGAILPPIIQADHSYISTGAGGKAGGLYVQKDHPVPEVGEEAPALPAGEASVEPMGIAQSPTGLALPQGRGEVAHPRTSTPLQSTGQRLPGGDALTPQGVLGRRPDARQVQEGMDKHRPHDTAGAVPALHRLGLNEAVVPVLPPIQHRPAPRIGILEEEELVAQGLHLQSSLL
ncbi:hypothetical protein HRbin23_01368 [bacterium HR23]|nr:hypothetical protein HRbin23_01368 [bacterium HR23]